MKKFKRLTAGLLGAVMALGVCSFTAFAADGDVAKIGDDTYTTLQDAVDAAGKGDKVVLINDTTENVVIDEDKEITIDLNGFTLSGGTDKDSNGADTVNKDKPAILNNGTVTIVDSDGDGVIKRDDVNVGDESYYVIDNQGEMTIKGGYIFNDSGVDVSGSSLIRNGGKTSGEEFGYAVLNIKGGELRQDNFIAVKNDDYGIVNISGGTITSKNKSAVQNWSEANFTGGKINGLILTSVWEDSFPDSKTTFSGDVKVDGTIKTDLTGAKEKLPYVEVKGGEFDVKWDIPDDLTEYVNVISGTFTRKVPADLIDKDSHLVEDKDGNYVVMDEEEYEDYKDDKKPSHSYELEEGKVDRNDDKDEPVVAPEPEEEGPFSDVGKDNPNYDAIIKVYENGWMEGIGEGVFAPNGTLTRAMGAMVLWNKAGNPEPQNAAPFLDVTADAWYAKAVAWAYEQGIIAGYDATTFGPDDALTTEQFTRMNDIASEKTPAEYIGGAPNATRGWVASLLAL